MDIGRVVFAILSIVGAALVVLLGYPYFLSESIPGAPVLIALAIVALFSGLFSWGRSLEPALRRRCVRDAALVLLALIVARLVGFWRQGELRDALMVLPFTLLGVSLALSPLLGLASLAGSPFRQRQSLPSPDGAPACGRTGWRPQRVLFSVALAVTLAALTLVPWVRIVSDVVDAKSTRMKSRGRGIWVSITAWADDRESAGLPLLWPRDLGFTGAESSTAYFRRLLSNEAGQVVEWDEGRIVGDLKAEHMLGRGLPEAASAEVFGPGNNAWQVVCIGDDAPAGTPFLITRNVDFGDTLTPTSQVRFIRSGPLKMRHIVWITRGGGCYDASFKRFKPQMLFREEWEHPDPDAPVPVYRVMRP